MLSVCILPFVSPMIPVSAEFTSPSPGVGSIGPMNGRADEGREGQTEEI